MRATLKKAASLAALLSLLAILPACGSVGIEPGHSIIFDCVKGTMSMPQGAVREFDPESLKDFRCFKTQKVVIPAPFTFGSLSFAWGGISTEEMLRESGFKRIAYAEYERFELLTVYTRYDITIYGN